MEDICVIVVSRTQTLWFALFLWERKGQTFNISEFDVCSLYFCRLTTCMEQSP